jgi:preprotein translocase subunit SecF
MGVYGAYFNAIGCHIMVFLNVLTAAYVATNGFMGYWLSNWSADFKNQANVTLTQANVSLSGGGRDMDADHTQMRLIVYCCIGVLQGNIFSVF